MREAFKDIIGYEGSYQVSNLGKIKSLKYGKERILIPLNDNYGYLMINLSKNGIQRTRRIHRLVAEAFIPNPNNLPEVNHKNGNKTQNVVNLDDLYGETTNLEWATHQKNCKHRDGNGLRKAPSGKNHYLYGKQVCPEKHKRKVKQYDLQGNFIKTWERINDAQRELHIRQGNIISCCKGKRKTAGGYVWKYERDFF